MAGGLIRDFNSLTDADLDEIRRIPPEERVDSLRRRCTPICRAYLQEFLAEVVDAGADVTTFGRGRVLVPGMSFDDVMRSSVADVLDLLGAPGDRGWFILWAERPEELRDMHFGGPAVVRREVSYLWTPPENVTGFLLTKVSLRPVARIDVAVRRWMAYRIWLVSDTTPPPDLDSMVMSPDA